MLIWPSDLYIRQSVLSLTVRSRAVSAHINCTCALLFLEKKTQALFKYVQLFCFQLTESCFSVLSMRYVDKLRSHFLFHQRCARGNSHTNFDIAFRHVTDQLLSKSVQFCDILGTVFWWKLFYRSRNYYREMGKYDTGICKLNLLHCIMYSCRSATLLHM